MKDFKGAANKLLSTAETLVTRWLPNGKRKGNEWVVGSLDGEPGESLSINLTTGVWSDFAKPEIGGNDLLSLYAALHNIAQGEAYEQLIVEDEKPQITFANTLPTAPPPHRYLKYSSGHWNYTTIDGLCIGQVYRFDTPEGKVYSPLTPWLDKGKIVWRWKGFAKPLPFYIKGSGDKILIVEGEKAADAAHLLLPEFTIITWPGGAGNVKYPKWKSIKGKEIYIWPDNDAAGESVAEYISKETSGKIVSIPGYFKPKWDLADVESDFDPRPYILRSSLALAKDSPPKKEDYIDLLNKEYAVVLRGSQVTIMRHWMAEDKITRLTFLSVKDFHVFTANLLTWHEGKQTPISKLWLESPRRKQYEEIYFRPLDKQYETRYNLWQGFGVTASELGQFDKLLHHIFHNICGENEAHYNWFIDWLADLIQKPYRKPGTAIILRGEMGVGKGALAKHVGRLFGLHYIPILHGGQLTGRFNSHLADKVLIFVDESGWSQDKYGAGILRGLITESHIAIEMKGKDTITLENYSRFIIAANNEWVVPTSMADERRMACFDVANTHKQDKPYFAAIDEQMNSGGYEAFLHFLLNHQYDENDVRTIPMTSALLDQKINSMTKEGEWWLECLLKGKIGDTDIANDYNIEIETDRLYEAYLEFCDKLKKPPLSKIQLVKNLKPYVELVKVRKGMKVAREHYYIVPELQKARDDFDKKLGQKYDWD